jgi:hypothetical protein
VAADRDTLYSPALVVMRAIPWALVYALAPACTPLHDMMSPPPTVMQTTPEPASPLTLPTVDMNGGRGDADAAYPPDFSAMVKSDGTVVFPQHTQGRIKGASVVIAGNPVLTVNDDGSLKGLALKHKYKFDGSGALLDESGNGVSIQPDGSVRGVGGEWHYKAPFAWTAEGGGAWDHKGWRTLEIVALVVLENMLPGSIRESDAKGAAPDGGKGKGATFRFPPPSEWFK